MSFTSFVFPLFLLAFVGLYYVVPKRWNQGVLLCFSWAFYAYHHIPAFLLLAVTTSTTFAAALFMEKTEKQCIRRSILIAALGFCFGVLFAFKYLGFFADTAVSLANDLGISMKKNSIYIMLPIGISFYTFQTASYLADVYLGKNRAEKSFCAFAVFVSFFPQLVAGPIERYGYLMPQLKEKHAFRKQNIQRGLAMILCGYVKKVAVADTVGMVVNTVYNHGDLSHMTALTVAMASALFFVQIYCDFSGYSDIAVGCAQLVGIQLSRNFDRPFMAESVTAFWSRWHITLSRWFREYVYLPLAYRSMRKGHRMLHHCCNTMIVMLLCGLWHGAGWNFILWGVFFGLLQIGESLLRRPWEAWLEQTRIDADSGWYRVVCRAATFLVMTLSMILFRANSMPDALTLYSRLLLGWGERNLFSLLLSQTGLTLSLAAILLSCIALMVMVDHFIAADGGEAAVKRPMVALVVGAVLLWCVLLASAYQAANGHSASFIYFQF